MAKTSGKPKKSAHPERVYRCTQVTERLVVGESVWTVTLDREIADGVANEPISLTFYAGDDNALIPKVGERYQLQLVPAGKV